MLLAAEEIIEFTRGCTREDLSTNRMLMLAVLRSIEVLGEAASRITPAGRARWPDVPWKAIIGMRSTLIHVYFDINLDNVWDTVVSDIPPLRETLRKHLPPDLLDSNS